MDKPAHRMWVSDDGKTWHWFCEGLSYDPRGPAKCGAQPDPAVTWKGRQAGQWLNRLDSNRPASVCEGCTVVKKREDLRGRRYLIFADERALLGLKIRCGTCLMASASPDDVVNRYCGNCHLAHDRYEDDLPPGRTEEDVLAAHRVMRGYNVGA